LKYKKKRFGVVGVESKKEEAEIFINKPTNIWQLS
jgi:helix-turn-helix protein